LAPPLGHRLPHLTTLEDRLRHRLVTRDEPHTGRGKVLVLGQDNRSFLTVIRSLGRRGLEVHVAWAPRDDPALDSRYIARVHDLSPYAEDGTWKAELCRLMQQERFDLVIPTNEPSLLPLQLHRSELEPFGRIALLADRAYPIALDKVASYELAQELGIPVPRQIAVHDPSDAEWLISALGSPVVLKPHSSFSVENLVHRRSVRKAYSAAEVRATLDAMLPEGAVTAQQHFVGRGIGVGLLAERGQILFAYQYERIHEQVRGGDSSLRRSVPVDPALRDAASRLMHALDYTGVAMLEFRSNPATGDWIFVEINPRFWGSLPLAVAAGADFPWYLYQLLVESNRDVPQGYAANRVGRNLVGDVLWTLDNLRADRTDPTLATRPLVQVVKDFGSLVALREHNDTFVVDDPRPALAEVATMINRIRRRASDRLWPILLSVPIVRTRFVRAARRSLHGARTILFVCKGNIYRSPFAHQLALASLPSTRTVISAGILPPAHRQCPADAITVAAEHGVSLCGHRSCLVTADLVGQADVIFAFDEATVRYLRVHYPEATRKLHRFGHLATSGRVDISDPFGGNIDRLRACYRSIAATFRSCLAEGQR
jgi:protein-tyrosine-phosphatase/predicted ATP-grasp superfamily ATP-dependent carboligase